LRPRQTALGAVLLLTVSLLAAACDPSASTCGDDNPEPEIELGTGELEFVPIDDGDSIQLVLGPQGGFHLLGSLRVRGMPTGDPDNLEDPENPTGQFEVLFGETDLIISSPFTQGLDPIEDCEGGWAAEKVGRFAILDVEDDETLDGQSIHFAVQLETPDGIQVHDERQLVVEPHPLNF